MRSFSIEELELLREAADDSARKQKLLLREDVHLSIDEVGRLKSKQDSLEELSELFRKEIRDQKGLYDR